MLLRRRLVNVASANRLVVYSAHFQHLQHHLAGWSPSEGCTSSQADRMTMRCRWASSVIDCWAYNRAQTDSQHGSVDDVVCTRLRQRMKAVCLSNRPPNLDNAKLNMTALENLRFQGVNLNGNAPSGNEWLKLNDVIAEASQTRM